jgi:hypothetical protein
LSWKLDKLLSVSQAELTNGCNASGTAGVVNRLWLSSDWKIVGSGLLQVQRVTGNLLAEGSEDPDSTVGQHFATCTQWLQATSF